MKKCPYCAKEIDYSEMYCCSDCESGANEYYNKRLKYRIPMNIIYIAGTALMALGIFFSPIFNFWGLMGVAAGTISMGIATVLLPSPTDGMIKKHKLLKAQKKLRIFGMILVAIGIAALISGILRLFL